MRLTLADSHARPLSRNEVRELFRRRNLLRIAFLDNEGWPTVHPVWFYYGKERFYFAVDRYGRKACALRKNPNVYFLVDESPVGKPPRGVRGRAIAKVIDDQNYAIKVTRQNVKRYLGTTHSRSAKRVLALGRESCVIEVAPKTMATWKF